MDKRLINLKHIQGDMAKINVVPEKRAALIEKYGLSDSAVAVAA